MERLMISDGDGHYVPKAICTIDRLGGADDCESCQEVCDRMNSDCDKCPICKALDKLAEYEKAGLEPNEIKKIADELEQYPRKEEFMKWLRGGDYGEKNTNEV